MGADAGSGHTLRQLRAGQSISHGNTQPIYILFLSIVFLGVCGGCLLRQQKEIKTQVICRFIPPALSLVPQPVLWQGEPREHPDAPGPVRVL